MKTKLLLLLTILSYSARAQQTDKAIARVRYTFTHIQDTTQRDKPYTENMLLITGKNASLYTSYDKMKRSKAMKLQIQEQIRNQAGGPTNIRIENRETGPVSNIDYFSFASDGKLIVKERVVNDYLIEEELPKIDWKISKDTASFSGLLCQKATASFKGRSWIAWFAPDLPLSSGPWKLNGLPGLIVEAHDSNKEVYFQFAGLEKVTAAPQTDAVNGEVTASGTTVRILGIDTEDYSGNEIKVPSKAIRTTRKELDKLKSAFEKDPEGFMTAQMAAQGIKGSFKMNRTPGSGIERRQRVVNNPIERAAK
ncbi:hypothetical protein C7T94_07385 [Pedobacter yulinensis]|uniref:GLPGLI family protein n=1 Tax=Pedobacter yulinensis TaxID=2126353 RepID=A0A2T3HJ81_9SPHI|nr:GLPGLI family protein [Pedobacter yulinensis]PST82492.1 hypothetical protein C7T94_07385 [Pedobacter yulinensis]